MRIEHIAIWADDLEVLKQFYELYFHATANDKYHNSTKGFSSYFLSFSSGARLELMQMENISTLVQDSDKQYTGISHIAFTLGSKEKVDNLTEQFKHDGVKILDGPRQTGDGYYETLILDPEGNRVEITA